MKIEGYFSQNEINSAIHLGATVERLEYNKMRLNFVDSVIYQKWLADQQQKHPNEWETFLVLTPRKTAV